MFGRALRPNSETARLIKIFLPDSVDLWSAYVDAPQTWSVSNYRTPLALCRRRPPSGFVDHCEMRVPLRLSSRPSRPRALGRLKQTRNLQDLQACNFAWQTPKRRASKPKLQREDRKMADQAWGNVWSHGLRSRLLNAVISALCAGDTITSAAIVVPNKNRCNQLAI